MAHTSSNHFRMNGNAIEFTLFQSSYISSIGISFISALNVLSEIYERDGMFYVIGHCFIHRRLQIVQLWQMIALTYNMRTVFSVNILQFKLTKYIGA